MNELILDSRKKTWKIILKLYKKITNKYKKKYSQVHTHNIKLFKIH